MSASRLRTWLQLVRAPNLFTVPGDPLAGHIFAGQGIADPRVAFAVLASLAFYSAGLLQNDLADEAEDRAERPSRPLPSGAANPRSVRIAQWALNLAGLGALAATGHTHAMLIGVLLIACIWLYNRQVKSTPVVGALTMGACRGLSVLLGAACWPLPHLGLGIGLGVIVALYIAAITNLARHETRAIVPTTARVLPFAAILLGAVPLGGFASQSPDRIPTFIILAFAIASAAWLLVKLFRTPLVLPPLIGAHIRLLLPLQAAACWAADPWGIGRTIAIVLLAFFPLSRLVAKKFYAS